MIRNNRILYLLLLFLPLAPLALSSCESGQEKIQIELELDYSGLLAAVQDANRSLTSRMALIESAVNDGLADNQQAMELIRKLIASLAGTAAEKMAAVAGAMKLQTTSLEAKVALVEAAVSAGFADSQAQQALLEQAVSSLGGSMEERFAAVEAAVKSQTTSLETKLGLIEASARSIAAENDAALALIGEALAALDGTLESKYAAVEAAVASRTIGLDTKLGLIASALETGFLQEKEAVETTQKALAASLGDLDEDLVQVRTAIVGQLDSLSSQLSPAELAKALQDVRSAIDKQTQSTAGMLASIQRSLNELAATINTGDELLDLIYIGHPTVHDTVSCGQSIAIRLRVNPSTVHLTEEMLQLEQKDPRQFFLSGTDRSKAVKNHFPSFTLQEDPDADGQYIVTVQTLVDELYKYWDETSLVFSCKTTYGKGQSKTVSSQPIPVVVLPNPQDGLSLSGIEKNASFLIDKTLGFIYQPLGSVEFTDGSETRTYRADFLASALFDPAGSLAVQTAFDREKHFVGLRPDTTDNGWRPLFDSTHVNHKEILGYLELTDRWGGNCSPSLSGLSWYTSYDDTLLLNPTIVVDGSLGSLQVDLSSKATALGLNLGEAPGSIYCSVHFKFTSAGGVWHSAQFEQGSWKLDMKLAAPVPSWSQYTVDAVITQTVQPDGNNPAFRPVQRMARIRVNIRVE